MPSAIGIRIYRVRVFKEDGKTIQPLRNKDGVNALYVFLSGFVKNQTASDDREDIQRSWLFSNVVNANNDTIYGHIRYGIYGFESDMVDRETRQKNYKRKSTDLEEVPLFFEFWAPAGENHAFLVFQSFRGRSCVQMVLEKLSATFSKNIKNLKLRINKIMPEDVKNSSFYSSPVKSYTLVKRNTPKDIADKYLHGSKETEVDFEITLKSKRKRNLGALKDYFPSAQQSAAGVIEVNGMVFDEARAQISIGNRRRMVGIFGHSSDAGVIDVTDAVQFGPDGHPTIASIKNESEDIMHDFNDALKVT